MTGGADAAEAVARVDTDHPVRRGRPAGAGDRAIAEVVAEAAVAEAAVADADG